jgi:hypothetical protein
MERVTIEELDDAAEAYVEARDKRMKLTEKEVVAKQALIEAMQRHKLKVYKAEGCDPPLTVTITDGDAKVKVSMALEDWDPGKHDHDAEDDEPEAVKPKLRKKPEAA